MNENKVRDFIKENLKETLARFRGKYKMINGCNMVKLSDAIKIVQDALITGRKE